MLNKIFLSLFMLSFNLHAGPFLDALKKYSYWKEGLAALLEQHHPTYLETERALTYLYDRGRISE